MILKTFFALYFFPLHHPSIGITTCPEMGYK